MRTEENQMMVAPCRRARMASATAFPSWQLMSLTSSQKMKLLQEHVVMCKDLRKNVQLLDNLALSSHEKQSVTAELDAICA